MSNEGSQQLDGTFTHMDRLITQTPDSQLHNFSIPAEWQGLSEREGELYQEKCTLFSVVTKREVGVLGAQATDLTVDNTCIDLQHTCSDM